MRTDFIDVCMLLLRCRYMAATASWHQVMSVLLVNYVTQHIYSGHCSVYVQARCDTKARCRA